MTLILFIAIAVLAYLAGAIPFGLIYSKIRGVDIRKVGSGNIGATNVGRQFGFLGGFLPVFVFDALKGAWAVVVVRIAGVQGMDTELAMLIVAILAIVGHMFPVYLGFKGGKGVATAAGAFLALAPLHAAIALVVFLIFFFATKKTVAVGSIAAAIAFPGSVAVVKPPFETLGIYSLVVSIVAGVLIIVAHRSNIKKLLGLDKDEAKDTQKPETK